MRVPFLDLTRVNAQVVRDSKRALKKVYASSRFILGPEVTQFEEEYSQFLGNGALTVGVGNGTDALEIAFRSLQLAPGAEVLVPSNSFIASAIGAQRAGLTVRLVDPDPETLLLDVRAIQAGLTHKTVAVLVVHLFGNMAPMQEIMDFAGKAGLMVVEDAAQAHGAVFRDQMAGTWGHIAATSFYPGKNLGAFGDGGAVTTRDASLASRARLIRNLGSEEKYVHNIYGFNSRLDSLQASVLSKKLAYLPRMNHDRAKIAQRYAEVIFDLNDITVPKLVADSNSVHHLFPVLTPRRDELMEFLLQKEVETLIHYPVPIHLQKSQVLVSSESGWNLPISEKASRELLSLPIFPGMKESEVSYVIDLLVEFFD